MTEANRDDGAEYDDEATLSAAAARRFDLRFDFPGPGFDWIPEDVMWAVVLIARIFDAPPDQILQEHDLSPSQRDARMVAIYVIHVDGGVSMSEIARRLDLDLSGVSRIVSRVEDWRSEPRWDAILDGVSTALRTGKRIRPLLKESD